MTKAFVDELIRNMKQAEMVEKALPWMVEGFGEKQLNTRYVGIAIKEDWLEIFPQGNNLLIKFIVGRNDAFLECYIANKPPFFRFYTVRFTINDKWEILLGELKRRFKKDKLEYLAHKEALGNIFAQIKNHLK